MLNHKIIFIITSPISIAQKTHLNCESVEHNAIEVERYLSIDKANLPFEHVMSLSSSVIQNRQLYSQDTLGMVFILLADIASNKGDTARAFQFANDGVALRSINKLIRLKLMLKIAEVILLRVI